MAGSSNTGSSNTGSNTGSSSTTLAVSAALHELFAAGCFFCTVGKVSKGHSWGLCCSWQWTHCYSAFRQL
jgi:hypothetical protein